MRYESLCRCSRRRAASCLPAGRAPYLTRCPASSYSRDPFSAARGGGAMSPTSTRVRSFAARLAQDDAFRALVAKDPRSALAEYDLPDEPGLIPEVVELPAKRELQARSEERRVGKECRSGWSADD